MEQVTWPLRDRHSEQAPAPYLAEQDWVMEVQVPPTSMKLGRHCRQVAEEQDAQPGAQGTQ